MKIILVRNGEVHTVNGIPIIIETNDPERTEYQLMRNRDPKEFYTIRLNT